MQFIETGFEGLLEIKPQVFQDSRGYFFETYREDIFKKAGIDRPFLQSNQSSSSKGVVRGLHLQMPPHAQAKLVRVLAGKVLDVVVDCRKESDTFGKHYTCLLSGAEHNMLYVPQGFAHGFVSLEESVFHYFCDDIYNRDAETGILWNDPSLQIDWQISEPIISEKDQLLPTFEEFCEINTF